MEQGYLQLSTPNRPMRPMVPTRQQEILQVLGLSTAGHSLYKINTVMTGSKAFLLRALNATIIERASNNNSTSVLGLSQIVDRRSSVSAALGTPEFCTSSTCSRVLPVALSLSSWRTKHFDPFCWWQADLCRISIPLKQK